MSTPRQICSNIHYENEEGIAAMYQCQLYKGHPGAHDSHPDKPNEGMLWKDSAEGVAAPLEPTPLTAKQFWEDGDFHMDDLYLDWDDLCDVFMIAEAYAAAVSKNLTDKYAEMEAKWMRELLTVSEEIGTARNRILQAEDMIRHYLASGYLPRMSAEEAREWLKEIAALKKKGESHDTREARSS